MEINKFKVSDGFPDCYASLQVDDDSFKVGQGHSLIGTFGIATCLAITLYSPKTKLGVLAHIGGFSWSPEPVGPKNIIDTMVKAMLQRERVLDDLEATLCGEAFGAHGEKAPIVRNSFERYGINLIGEDLGGQIGRLAFLNCNSGIVEIYRA